MRNVGISQIVFGIIFYIYMRKNIVHWSYTFAAIAIVGCTSVYKANNYLKMLK
jgi:hypothetical protein